MSTIGQRTKGADEIFCQSCGEVIKALAEICPECGVRQRGSSGSSGSRGSSGSSNESESSTPVLLNVILGFLGVLGIGHIVKGRVGTGIAFLISGIALFVLFWTTIWFLVGLIFIPIYIGLWIFSIVNVKK